MLTCYHAVKPNNQNWNWYLRSSNTDDVVYHFEDGHTTRIGRIVVGMCNHYVDVALIELKSSYEPRINNTVLLRGIGKVKRKQSIRFKGATDAAFKKGRIKDIKNPPLPLVTLMVASGS